MGDQADAFDQEAVRLNGYERGSLIDRVGAYSAYNPRLRRDDSENLELVLQHEVKDLLGLKKLKFPGAQPVSFSRKHIEELKREDYYVCEKTDGLRFLLWCTREPIKNEQGQVVGQTSIHYLIDRRNRYFYVPQLFFPHHDSKDFSVGHFNTILDGELVEDRRPDGTSEIKFYVFDCLIIDNNNLMHRTLDKRLAYFNTQLLSPYKKWVKQIPDHPARAFQLQGKQNEFSYAMEMMFKETLPNIKQLHGNDGLIFTCKETPYCPGTDPHILKWKPPNENTVDFLVHITWQTVTPDPNDPDQTPIEDYDALPAEFALYVMYSDNHYEPHGTLFVTPDEWENLKREGRPLQDAIVECFLEDARYTSNGFTAANGNNGVNGDISSGNANSNGNDNGNNTNTNGSGTKRWRFHRTRDDKEEANHISTYQSVIDSIEDRVTEEDLIGEQTEIRRMWKARAEQRKQQQQGQQQQGGQGQQGQQQGK